MKVPTVVTKFTELELAKALIVGYRQVFGEEPTQNTLVNAWSQVALECGRDGKGLIIKCRCYNLGNITISTAQYKAGRDYWALRCKEQLRDKNGKLTGEWQWFDMRFAANASLEAGANHYFTFFSDPKRKIALDAMRKGGPTEFTGALAAIWYMTANPDHYLKGLNNLRSIAVKSVNQAIAESVVEPPEPPQTEPVPDSPIVSNDESVDIDPTLFQLETEADYISPDDTQALVPLKVPTPWEAFWMTILAWIASLFKR